MCFIIDGGYIVVVNNIPLSDGGYAVVVNNIPPGTTVDEIQCVDVFYAENDATPG